MEIGQCDGAVLLSDVAYDVRYGERIKPPIAILFANLKGNIGDFAILHAMLCDLAGKFPGQAIHVFPHGHHPIDEARFAAFKASCEVLFELAGKTYFRESGPKWLESAIRLSGLWPMAQAGHIRSLADSVAAHASLFRKYDAIFLAGGEHWGGTRGAISMFGTLAAVHHHNLRIYAYPFSVNPRIRSFNTRPALQRYFRLIAAPLLVRDGMSKATLDELGLDAMLGIDCVYSMQSLANAIAPMANRDRSRIIFALTGSRSQFKAELSAALRRLGPLANKIALMTTCECEDGKTCETIARDFGTAYYAPLSWQEAVAEIKASALLVTNRLHGLIFGSLAQTPLLPVTNRKKAKAFVRDTQVPHSAAGPRDIGPALLERCLADRNAILDKMQDYRRPMLGAVCSPLHDAPASGSEDAQSARTEEEGIPLSPHLTMR